MMLHFTNRFLFSEQAYNSLSGENANPDLRYWIGVSNINQKGWQNTDDGSDATYFDWAAGEPTNLTASNGCVSVDLNGGWHDDDCLNPYPFICELNETAIPSTSALPSTIFQSPTSQGSTLQDLTTENPITQGPTATASKYYPVVADVVFIFDVSTAVSSAQFQDTKTFILNVLDQFNVGYQKGVQVSLLSVYGDDNPYVSTDSNFSGITDYTDLTYALNYGYLSNASSSGTGQVALVLALQRVMNQDIKGAGYRNTIKNHVIVYITTSSILTQASINQASLILNDGSYKIVAISYQGNGNDINSLQELVGGNPGCVLTSVTQADYTGAFAQSFADKLLNAYK